MATDPPSPKPVHSMPFVRLELAVLGVQEGGLQVLLGKRTEPPYAGRWALPGGVLRIDLDADLEASCQRVAQERLGCALPHPVQVGAVGARQRDPRAPWALSVVYRSLVPTERVSAAPGKRLEALKWVPADEAAADKTLAFDHATLIGQAVLAARAEIHALVFPPELLAAQFTLAELQATSEAVLGRRLDKSSFRRRVDDAGCVRPIQGAVRTGAFRPAQLFELTTTSTTGAPA